MKEIKITTNESGQRLDKFLRKYLKEMPLSGIYKAIRKKDITVNGGKSSEKYILNEGDIITFKIDIEDVRKEKNTDFLNIDYNVNIAYEDENILVAEKGNDILVHPDEGGEITLTDNILAYLFDKGEYDPKDETTFAPSPCNRLDRNTSGLVIFAKNYDALKCMNEIIRENGIEKYYITIVKGRVPEGVHTAYIQKDERTNRVRVVENYVKGSKEIITETSNLDSVGSYSEIEVNLITGRSHQIRAHLSWMGNPIIGDPKYGDKEVNKFFKKNYNLENQLLLGYKLIFRRCTGNLKYLEGKVVTMKTPVLYKKIRKDVFKFV